jgi:hypothetical protein
MIERQREGCQYPDSITLRAALVDQPAEQIAAVQPAAADRQRWRRLPVTRRCRIDPAMRVGVGNA